LQPNSKVLDIGCGTGKLFPVIASLGKDIKIIGLDMCLEMLKYAEKFKHPHLELLHCFCENIPLQSNSIDAVFVNDTFPHFHDQKQALQEICRVLKKNGELYIIHTNCSEQVNQTHRNIGHPVARDLLPPLERLVALIEAYPFEVKTSKDTNDYLLINAQKVS